MRTRRSLEKILERFTHHHLASRARNGTEIPQLVEILLDENAARHERPSNTRRAGPVKHIATRTRTAPAVLALRKALNKLSITIPRGEFLVVTGPSGCGKSTLLNLIAGLDVANEGEIRVDGEPLAAMSDSELTAMRRTRVGVVFQFFNLLPYLTALDNVALPLRARGLRRRDMLERAERALTAVAMAGRADHRPLELSGGEMQRVAIARALVIEPSTILADEPTGNLDSGSGTEILRLLRTCNHEQRMTIVLVTHSAAAAAYGDRVVALQDGQIVEDTVNRPEKPRPHLRPLA
jgi:putative ABC transport system ATP-binding protein